MKKTITKIGVSLAAFLPVIAFAQQKDLKYVISLIVTYFNYAVYLIMGLAVVLFVWNIFKYFIKGSDSVGDKKEAGQYVLWSVVGFFVILSFWGMVNILTNTFKLDSTQPSGFFGTFGSSSSGGNSGLFDPNNRVIQGQNTGLQVQGQNTGLQAQGQNKGIIRTVWGMIW